VRFYVLDVRFDKAGDADLCIHAHLARRHLAVAGIACHFAGLLYAEVACACPRRIVAEHIQRTFACVQPVATAFDVAVNGKFLADFILHPAALHLAVHALVGNDLIFHVVSPFSPFTDT
jgi:hypothetical protein